MLLILSIILIGIMIGMKVVVFGIVERQRFVYVLSEV
ncbi:hypothetical protein IE3_00717 [Bacillus cereus BAG3X2-1]|nr:hypothetical protein IE3_00717 [Bacillus cereus BAG3X2-1]